ncbi:MAG: roadblock/LC7 domain-containing protein [Candidatus Thorarchaeota archaeon]
MSVGRGQRLNDTLRDVFRGTSETVRWCIVTNERGLIVASITDIGPQEEKLAAMASLLSETSKRISTNIEGGKFDTANIEFSGHRMSMAEFPVRGRPFRIAVVTSQARPAGLMNRLRRLRHPGVTKLLSTAAVRIAQILEE